MKKSDQVISQLGNQEEEPGSPILATADPNEEVLHANTPEEEGEVFELGRWGEFPQWRCRECAWDTLEGEEAFMEHYRAVHLPAPEAPRPSIIPIADRFGNEVK